MTQGSIRFGEHCQSPRRRKGFGSLIKEATLHERIGHKLLQILRRTALHAGGDFFGEEFEEKVGHGGTLKSEMGG